MKKLFTFLSLILMTSFAQAELPATVAAALKKAGIPESGAAMYVQAVDANQPSLTVNADRPMNPASVMKLVTTYAAIDLLKPTFRWKTEVYRDAVAENGILQGNLIIKGYGDPSFKEDEFR